MPYLIVTRTVVDAMTAAARRAMPEEACGLLLGKDWRIDSYVAAANVAADPLRHFEVDPARLLAAYRTQREGGPVLIGYYHSHPAGPPRPSATDATQAARDGKVWAIGTPQGEIGWFISGPAGFAPVTPRLVPGSPEN